MGETTIGWTDRSVNPFLARDIETGKRGHWCEKVSPGCTFCYSSAMQPFRFHGHEFLAKNREKVEVFFDRDRLDEVLRRRKPTKWFWWDMTDGFGPWVPDAWLDHCFAVMALTPWHVHQLLTKRPERMLSYLNDPETEDRVYQTAWEMQPGGIGARTTPRDHPADWRWPLPNVWCGTSIEDQPRADLRVPILRRVPAAIRFLSIEPLLGPIDLEPLLYPRCNGCGELKMGFMFDDAGMCWSCRRPGCVGEPWTPGPHIAWAIIGGESNGPKDRRLVYSEGLQRVRREEPRYCCSASTCPSFGQGIYSGEVAEHRWHQRTEALTWVRSLRDQLEAAGVALYFKQWGGPRPTSGGRTLDGRTWDEFPVTQKPIVDAV